MIRGLLYFCLSFVVGRQHAVKTLRDLILNGKLQKLVLRMVCVALWVWAEPMGLGRRYRKWLNSDY